jgi:hypothetical protein
LEADAAHEHSFIEPSDEIYFFYEYTAYAHTGGAGFGFSPGNNLVNNLKKDVVRFRDNAAVMSHKRRAIRQCAEMIQNGLSPKWLAGAVIVPVPPSKLPGDAEYDDRMVQVARAVQSMATGTLDKPAEVRCLIRQTSNLRKSHESEDGERVSLEDLLNAYEIDESLCQPEPERIAILDDMLTTGRHLRAVHKLLSTRFPRADIVGVFITRRVVPEGTEFDIDGFLDES